MGLRHRLLRLLLLLWFVAPALVTAADPLVVITHRSGEERALTRPEVINIFLGRYKKLPGGQRALPLDTEPHRARFYHSLVRKTLPEINAYWARLTFSGQTTAPRQVSLEQVLAIVATTPGAIGYVPKHLVDHHVRIVFELED